MNKKIISIIVCVIACTGVHAELPNYPLDTINGEEVYRYEVERSIGLYRIGVNFNVPQSEIIRLNPQLRERGLHFGETLLIPTGRPVIAQENMPSVSTDTKETVTVATDTITTVSTAPNIITPDSIAPDTAVLPLPAEDTRRVVELALMLPFESRQTKRSANAERMMEFYQGALLALRNAQNDSMVFRLRVYDTERSERRVVALCDSDCHELDSVHGVIGLAYPVQIARMEEWCSKRQVPLLLPFSDETDLTANPMLMQFNSTDEQEADSLAAWIAARDSSLNCVVINVKEADKAAFIRTLCHRLKANGTKTRILPLHDLMNDSASYAMDSTKENLVILQSDRYQNIRMLLPNLERLQDTGFRIRLVSQYSWQKEQITLPQIYTSVFTGEADSDAYDEAWSTYYTNSHVSDSPRYDLIGYDLTRAMILRLRGEKAVQGLQSDIIWQQKGETGGWQNAGMKVIEN